MNIVFINVSDGAGGATDVACDLKTELEKRGHKVSLFVKRKHTKDPNVFLIKKESKLLKSISNFVGKDLNSVLYNKYHEFLSNDIEYYNNDNLLHSEELKKADIIHCFSLHNNFFNLQFLSDFSKTKPIIWTLCDMWAFTPHEAWIVKDNSGNKKFSLEVKPRLRWNNKKHLFKKKREIYSNSHLYLVTISKWMRDEIKKSLLSNFPCEIVYPGINKNIYIPTDKNIARQKLGLPTGKKIISFIANAGKNNMQKGWQYALKVINHYSKDKNILFLCIGGKSEESNIDNDNIKYIDFVKDKSVLGLYLSASDIFLNPSLAESFSLVVVGAMACGTPIVTFPVGIVFEAITHKVNGYIAKYQNADDLIKGVDYIFSMSEEEITNLKNISREIVTKNYTHEFATENYLKLYKKILN
jgi:glycosyltransferase involved in cell wall biosynthesis